MPRQDINPDERSIRASNFGGLNTITSSINQPVTDAVELTNIDTRLSGSLAKRRGTYQYISDTATTKHVHTFVSNYGHEFLLLVSDKAVKIYSANTLIQTFNNVFRLAPDAYFVSIPGVTYRNLILSEDNPPVQIEAHEYYNTSTAASSTIDFTVTNGVIKATAAFILNAKVFVNGVLDTGASFVNNTTSIEVTPTSSLSEGDRVTLVYFTWSWWAEAEFWYGDNFWKQVPRFGSNEADRLVLTPESIYSDFPDDSGFIGSNYLFTLYYTNNEDTFDSTQNGLNDVIYNRTSTPETELEYSFSNGDLTASTKGTSISPTKFAVIFGEESNPVFLEYELSNRVNNGSVINIPSHGLKSTDIIRLTTPDGTDRPASDGYYVKKLDEDRFEIYRNPDLSTSQFSVPDSNSAVVSSVNTTNGLITTTGTHGFSSGDPIRIQNAGGNVPTGYSRTVTYYARVASTTTLYLSISPNVQSDVVPSAAGSGTLTLRYWGTYEIEKQNYQDVFFRRRRNFSFRNGIGVYQPTLPTDGTNLRWSINNDWVNQNSDAPLNAPASSYNGLYITQTSGGSDAVLDDYSFVGGGTSVQTEDSVCRIVHVALDWTGSNAIKDIFQPSDSSTHYGGAYPAYGLGFYANYLTGTFPTVGVLHQERLILGGFPDKGNTVIASAIANTKAKDEYYNFFQITDDLQGLVEDPFDLVLSTPRNGTVNGLVSWQQLLFIFTTEEVLRTLNHSSVLSTTNRAHIIISNSGLVDKHCTDIADNQIFYLSKTGLYDLPIIFENEFRSEELSLKIRDKFTVPITGVSFVEYIKQTQSLFVYMNSELLVYNVITQAWSKYFLQGAPQFLSCNEYLNKPVVATNSDVFDGVLQFEYDKYLDYCVDYASGVTPQAKLLRETLPLSENQKVFKLQNTYVNQLNTDISVYFDDGIGGYTDLGDEFITRSSNIIELTDIGRSLISGSDNIYVVPNYSHTWYGVSMYAGNVPVRIDTALADFGTIDLSSTALVNFDTNQYDLQYTVGLDLFPTIIDGNESSAVTVGYVYPAMYRSPQISLESLYTNKQASDLSLFLDCTREIVNESDATTLEDTHFGFTGSLKEVTDISVGVLFNLDDNGCYSSDLFSNSSNPVSQLHDYVVYKERFSQTGVVFSVCLHSSNNNMFVVDAWQINLQSAQGTGYIGGVG